MVALSLPCALFAASALAQDPIELDPTLRHLGDTVTPTWEEVPAEPEGTRLDLEFRASRNASEFVLVARHRDVDKAWTVSINDAAIARLALGKTLELHHYVVPPGTLRNGKNVLSIVPRDKTDDIVIGEIRILRRTLRQVLDLQPVVVRIEDDQGRPVPVRLTVTDLQDRRVDLYYAADPLAATRKGLLYTATGEARCELPVGRYRVYATRGMEWSMDRADIDVKPDAAVAALSIRREVDTTGFISCDSHIHTLTFSGHGDSSVEERLVTLAGEGVELAIATDHNHNTDYAPLQKKMGLQREFKTVVGNEVTTKVGHINAFPLDPGDKPPNHQLGDWVRLVDEMRDKGAEVVVLNHPRWPKLHTGPFGEMRLDRMTGDRDEAHRVIPFDCMELVNSGTLKSDPLYLFTDWFALLNYGERIRAVGTSDSHTVGNPVGQGRTYLRSSTDDPRRIRLRDAFESFVDGTGSISLGIFCDVVVDGDHGMGSLVRVADRRVQVALRVAAPSWVTPRRAHVFLNGRLVEKRPVPREPGEPTDVTMTFDVATPVHDAYLVCVVVGDGIAGPYWPTGEPFTLAGTNPVFLDVDRDRKYRSPRETAQRAIARAGTDVEKLRDAMRPLDDTAALQVLSLARARLEDGAGPDAIARARATLREIAGGRPADREAFEAWLSSLPAAAGGKR